MLQRMCSVIIIEQLFWFLAVFRLSLCSCS